MAEVSLSSLLHLAENHGGDFLRSERPVFALVLNSDSRLAVFLGNLEWPVLDITLELGVIDLTTNETFGVEYGVGRVRVESVLG